MAQKQNTLVYEGRVTGEVKSKTFGSGKTLQEWSMSVYAGKSESWQNKRAYIAVKHWGTSAPMRGDDLVISGRLGAEVWTKDGKDNSKITIICESFELVGDAGDHKDARAQHNEDKANGFAPQSQTDDMPF